MTPRTDVHPQSSPQRPVPERERTTQRVIAGAVEMAVSRYPGTGHPVLLIHGLGAHQRMWDPLVAALGDNEVITFDFPGLGRSHVAGVPQTIPAFAELALKIIDDLGYAQVDVLGYSFGGMVAQQLTHAHPDRIRRLALVATAPGVGMVPGYPSAMFALATPLRYYSKRFYKWTNRFLAGGEIERDPAWMEYTSHVRKLYRPHPITYYSQLIACQLFTSLRWLHTVQTPTLVVHGTDDPIIPVFNAELMTAHLPNARMFAAGAEGHLLMQDAGSSSFGAITSFFARPDHRDSAGWQGGAEVTLDELAEAERRANLRAAQPMGLYHQVVRNSLRTADQLRKRVT
ncbi:alpha/beta fold hydrolase [Cumulibacter soli]|uniref:alpha/beta fold hydrolase n=1 Tax=Cumulibacter soli TaxID=2546344 RepID=UPI001067D276|nr:alpha/beta fold hydrolase [Cumulibacter soli]